MFKFCGIHHCIYLWKLNAPLYNALTFINATSNGNIFLFYLAMNYILITNLKT